MNEPYISTYLHAKGRKLGLPIAGNFELTSRCNFSCPMCYIHSSNTNTSECELSASQWLKIASDAKNMGMVFALLTGGEPLIREDFLDIYRGMKKLGLLISINTNASLIKGDILNEFINDPPSRLNISLYGGCPKTYIDMCKNDAFEDVISNIKKLKEAGIYISINLSMTPYNIQDIEKIKEIADSLQINVKATSYMYPPVRIKQTTAHAKRFTPYESAYYAFKWDQMRLSKEEFNQRAKNIENIKEDDCKIEGEDGVRCRAGSSSFWLSYDGKMSACGMMSEPVSLIENGFETAWKEILEKTKEIKTPKECNQCPYRQMCGACAAICYAENKRFDQVPEYMCQRTKYLIELYKEYVMKNLSEND